MFDFCLILKSSSTFQIALNPPCSLETRHSKFPKFCIEAIHMSSLSDLWPGNAIIFKDLSFYYIEDLFKANISLLAYIVRYVCSVCSLFKLQVHWGRYFWQLIRVPGMVQTWAVYSAWPWGYLSANMLLSKQIEEG